MTKPRGRGGTRGRGGSKTGRGGAKAAKNAREIDGVSLQCSVSFVPIR